MKKKVYERMAMTSIELEPGCTLLLGSKTSKSIKVNQVEVEDFEQGFDIGMDHNDFQEVSFD